MSSKSSSPLISLVNRSPCRPSEAVNIAGLLDGNDAGDGVAQQLGICSHLEAVAGLLVEGSCERRDRLILSLAKTAEFVQQLLRGQMVDNDGAVIPQIHHVERMQAILLVNIDSGIPVLENEDHTWFCELIGSNNSVEAIWSMLYIAVRLHVFQQIQAEFIQAQIHDGDAIVHVLNIHHLFLQALELLLAVF